MLALALLVTLGQQATVQDDARILRSGNSALRVPVF
jgi:hypothetical protein